MYFLSGNKDKPLLRRFENHVKATDSQEWYDISLFMVIVLHTLVAGLLARSQYPEGPAIGNLDTDFSWFPFVYKQMQRWFPRFQVATTCFLCSPPDLNLLDPYFIFMYMHYNWATAHLQLNMLLLLLL